MNERALDPYVPRVLLHHLVESPDAPVSTLDATVVFADISGFTKLSERLARRGGREGAEQLVDAIGGCFERLLKVAYDNGGSLLKFGGDALLLGFDGDGHVARACASAFGMRQELRAGGPVHGARLRISMGVHSGAYHGFLVGGSHRELIIAGPAATEVTLMEKAAGAGEILVSPATAARLPPASVGVAKGRGHLLRSAPAVPRAPYVETRWEPPAEAVAQALSPEVRAHVLGGRQPSEHRIATVAFLRAEGTDALIAGRGPEGAAEVIGELVAAVGAAADERQVCFLASDIDADGFKILLAAGAPRVVGDEEERMLLTLRRIVDDGPPLPIRIGVHRGGLFAGDIGPSYRRTYAAMGDIVNLAARLMAKAPPNTIYATPAVLDRSPTRFSTTAIAPFKVKGKARPVQVLAVEAAHGRRTGRDVVPVRFPLIGRERELRLLNQALDDASSGEGRLIELVSEPGMGRSRLMDEVRDRDDDFRVLRGACEPHTTATPYRAWRGVLREAAGIGPDDTDEEACERLRAALAADDPALVPLLPLLALALDVEAPPTAAVDDLAPEFRGPKLREVVLRFMRRQVAPWTLIELADAHLMDEASVELLHALELQLPMLPWLVVVTRRDSDRGFVATPGRHLVRLDLGPLGPEQTLALARAATESTPLPPHVVELAAERSGGSPQFLRDLLRAAADRSSELPESIEAAAMARIDRLQPADRTLVRHASVLGVSFDPRHLEELLGDDVPTPVPETWDRLGAYFAVEHDGRLRFRRHLVRDVAYAALPFRVRRELHAIAGTQRERELGADADDEAAALSVHFLLAGRHEKAWRYANVAAAGAIERSAFADAGQLYRRALEAAPHFDAPAPDVVAVWEALGEAQARTGELDEANAAFRTARRLVGADHVHEARLLLRHAQVAERAGRVVPAIRWARRGLRRLEGLDARAARGCRASILSILATVRQRQGRMREAITLCRTAIAEAGAAGEDAALAHACFILDWALFDSGRPEEATHSQRALAIYERLGELDRQAAVLNNLGGFAYHEGRWHDATAFYRRGAEASERAGDVANAAFGDCNVGEVLSDQGRWPEAEPRLRDALRVWRGSSYEWGTALAMAFLGRTLVRTGRHDEGASMLDESEALFRRLGAGPDVAMVAAYRAEAFAFQGEPEPALAEADRLLGTPGRTAPLLDRVRAFALVQQGALDLGELALETSLSKARAQGIDFEIAVTLDALDRLPGAADDTVRADRRRVRDGILKRLDVVAVPAPPWAPAVPAGTPA